MIILEDIVYISLFKHIKGVKCQIITNDMLIYPIFNFYKSSQTNVIEIINN